MQTKVIWYCDNPIGSPEWVRLADDWEKECVKECDTEFSTLENDRADVS